MPRQAATVETAYYGLGSCFPLVVLGNTVPWQQPSLVNLPELHRPVRNLLALRWCGPPEEEDAAPALLAAAAARAPALPAAPCRITAYEQTLPPHLHLVTVAPSDLIGPWANRPGHPTST